jgi:hypothetical protein
MKAVYPMVGASAAACKQNLKSASFTGTFNGGWSFASTGATPNGSTGFFNTTLIPSVSLNRDAKSYSLYSRTNLTGIHGATVGGGGSGDQIGQLGGTFYSSLSDGIAASTYATDKGLYLINRASSTSYSAFKNGANILNFTSNSSVNISNPFYFGTRNEGSSQNYFSTNELCLGTIGNLLTVTNISNFYTAVQEFQTTLGRQV